MLDETTNRGGAKMKKDDDRTKQALERYTA